MEILLKWIFPLIYSLAGLLLIGIALKMTLSTLFSILLSVTAKFWPKVSGQIISMWINESRYEEDEEVSYSYSPKVSYRYKINGREYLSNRFSFYSLDSEDRGVVRHTLRHLSHNDKVDVYVNPLSHKHSVLRVGVDFHQIGGLNLAIASIMFFGLFFTDLLIYPFIFLPQLFDNLMSYLAI